MKRLAEGELRENSAQAKKSRHHNCDKFYAACADYAMRHNATKRNDPVALDALCRPVSVRESAFWNPRRPRQEEQLHAYRDSIGAFSVLPNELVRLVLSQLPSPIEGRRCVLWSRYFLCVVFLTPGIAGLALHIQGDAAADCNLLKQAGPMRPLLMSQKGMAGCCDAEAAADFEEHLCVRIIGLLSEEQQMGLIYALGGTDDATEFTLNFALLDDATVWFVRVYTECCCARNERRPLLLL